MTRRVFASVLILCACSSRARTPPDAPQAHGEPLEFAFGSLDGSVVTSENTRGRLTALLFVTTYDLPSQAAARRLADAYRSHTPRFNAAAIVLEAAENAVLADVFRTSLGLPYPVALADATELRSSEAFSEVNGVPTLVLLDREGRLLLRRFGLFEPSEVSAWLVNAERGNEER